MVAYFQSIISEEIQNQLLEIGSSIPSKIIACLGGGSNAAGAFHHFYSNKNVELIAVEASGEGLNSGKSAATFILGSPGVLHGSLTLLMQDSFGQITEPHSISAGLDYPGIGPLHAYTLSSGRASSLSITDKEALDAALECSRLEGIIPALESAHALAAIQKLILQPEEIIIINLSGRGDKDINTYQKAYKNL
jgi:tryptophan synthase beta subunit